MSGKLHLTISHATALRSVQTFGKQDPFVKVKVAGHEKRTRVAEDGDKNPAWHENLEFHVPADWTHSEMNVAIWDDNKFSDELIGSLVIPLDVYTNAPGVTSTKWWAVRVGEKQHGQINITGMFMPDYGYVDQAAVAVEAEARRVEQEALRMEAEARAEEARTQAEAARREYERMLEETRAAAQRELEERLAHERKEREHEAELRSQYIFCGDKVSVQGPNGHFLHDAEGTDVAVFTAPHGDAHSLFFIYAAVPSNKQLTYGERVVLRTSLSLDGGRRFMYDMGSGPYTIFKSERADAGETYTIVNPEDHGSHAHIPIGAHFNLRNREGRVLHMQEGTHRWEWGEHDHGHRFKLHKHL